MAADFADLFANRSVLTDISGALNGSNVDATREPGEPRHGGKVGGKSVWVSWTAPADGIVTFDTRGSSFDTLLSAYFFERPTDTALDKLKEAAHDDDDLGSEPASLIQFGARAGITYHIAVDGYRGASGTITLHWDFATANFPPPVIGGVSSDRAVQVGDTVTLSVDMQTFPELELRWRFNGESLDEESTTLVIANFQPTNVGRYTLRIKIGDVRFETAPTELQINSEGQTNALAQDKLLDASTTPLTPHDDDSGLLTQQAPRVRPPPGLARGYNGTQIFNTAYATIDPSEPAHCGMAAGNTYWYSYQPPADGTLVLDTIGSSFDTFLAAYAYTPPLTNYADLGAITCDNDGAGSLAARVEFPVAAAQRYLLVVGGVGGARGLARLNYQLDTNRPPVAPVVGTLGPTRVAAVGAPVTLSAGAAGTPPLVHTWFRNGELLPGETNTDLVIPKAQFADEGDYSVRVTNAFGEATNGPVHVRIVQPPSLDYQRAGKIDLLSFETRAGQLYTLEWSKETWAGPWQTVGQAQTGDGTRLVFTNATADSSVGFYRVRVE